MQRQKTAYGFFWGDTWSDASQQSKTDEIALNPDQFRTRAMVEVLKCTPLSRQRNDIFISGWISFL
jgi:hypothetical protein